jgi:hypothetical protein
VTRCAGIWRFLHYTRSIVAAGFVTARKFFSMQDCVLLTVALKNFNKRLKGNEINLGVEFLIKDVF